MRYFIVHNEKDIIEGYTSLEREPVDWTGYKEVSLNEYKVILRDYFNVKFYSSEERITFGEDDIQNTAELVSYSLEDGSTTAEMLVYALEKISELEEKIKTLEEGVV